MAQQPNVENPEEKLPRTSLEPGPAVKWRSSKPGVPSGPADVPRGGRFGATGPDPGWAIKLVANSDLPGDDPNLRQVVIGLVQARAAAHGRAAIPEDIEAALALCGYVEGASAEVIERRERWLAASPHDQRPGATAVAELDRALIAAKPEQIRYAQRLGDKTAEEG